MGRKRRRHNTGFGYIGSGNKHSVFNRKPRKVFSEIKDILNTESNRSHRLKFGDKKLTKKERLDIKNKIRKGEKIRMIKVFVISITLSTILIFFLFKVFFLNKSSS